MRKCENAGVRYGRETGRFWRLQGDFLFHIVSYLGAIASGKRGECERFNERKKRDFWAIWRDFLFHTLASLSANAGEKRGECERFNRRKKGAKLGRICGETGADLQLEKGGMKANMGKFVGKKRWDGMVETGRNWDGMGDFEM